MTMHNLFARPFTGNLLALLAGVLLTLSFAPFHLFPLAMLSPALLLGTWLYVSAGRAFWRGFLFGLGFFGTGVYWIFISIHTFGNASLFLSTFITVGFILILAVFPALTGYFLNKFFKDNNPSKILLAFPAYWVFLEWIRSLIFTGFPWLLLGYSQTNSWLRGYAPLFSVFGVSLAAVLCSGLLVEIILRWRTHAREKALLDFMCIVIIWLVGFGFTFPQWTFPNGKPIQVSLIQGDIPQSIKWSPAEIKPTLERYTGLTNNHWDSKIIVWPEAAIPITLNAAASFINELDGQARSHNATLITGIPFYLAASHTYYNAVISVGMNKGAYLKRKLVPFGEYTPFHDYIYKLLGSLDIPMSDFVADTRRTPQYLYAGPIKISASICYEIAFPELIRSTDESIGMLLTVSDDAWFGHSIAQAQHLQIAQMRAMEMARPVLFAGNDGLTAVVDARGTIQAIAPPFQPYVLTAMVQPRVGITPWQNMGLDPLVLVLSLMLVMAVVRRRKY
jgi:apolipoprotein N-acyltransferase